MKKILVIVILLLTSRTFAVGASPVIPNEKSKKIALTFDACMTTGMLKRGFEFVKVSALPQYK